jgi:dihydroflavonol-4-reductase
VTVRGKVMVTGATGYLGRHLLTALRGQGAIALARRGLPAEWADEVGDARVVEGSPLEPMVWMNRLKDVGTIVHTAGVVKHSRSAKDAEEMTSVNVEGTLQVVRAARHLGARVVLISSSGTVGCFAHDSRTADEHAPYAERLVGRWPYYASKIRAERAARALASKLGVELSIVRLPVLLGPKDHKRRSTTHVTRVLDGHVPFVPSGGVHFTDVRDVAQALVRLAELPRARPIYHLPGTSSSLATFFKMVCEVSGATLDRAHAPAWLVHGVARLSARVPRRVVPVLPDPVVLEMATCHWGLISLWSEHELGYKARSGRQTVVDTVEWLRANPVAAAAARAA